jgi:iron(III) transport system substrate-binding protein
MVTGGDSMSMRRGWWLFGLLWTPLGCSRESLTERPEVIVYSAQDQEFADPVLKVAAQKTGVDVVTKYDVESSKTVGLVQRIIAEANRPRCDLFWNNEILNTLRLKEKGLLAPFTPPNAADYPAPFKDKDGTWYGFAARARILIVNTKLVAESDRPRGIRDLLDPKWKGKIGLAKPLFGTTATHAACLFVAWGDEKAQQFFRDLKANGAEVVSGNKQVATAVGSGRLAFGLTDTDDAMGEIEAGSPVAIVYPDRGADELGTLFIPNTLVIPKGAPHKSAAEALANHLLSPEVEAALARGPSAQIPLNPKVGTDARVETPKTVHAMSVDFEAAARAWDKVAAFLAAEFAGG